MKLTIQDDTKVFCFNGKLLGVIDNPEELSQWMKGVRLFDRPKKVSIESPTTHAVSEGVQWGRGTWLITGRPMMILYDDKGDDQRIVVVPEYMRRVAAEIRPATTGASAMDALPAPA